LCDQLLDRTTGAGTRGAERTFFDHAAVHVELADPCCGVMRAWLDRAAGAVDASVHNGGVYVTIDGPQFSTRAESRMHRAMGADVVGMTALPEARLAREAEIAYALVALPTDYDSWRQPPPDQPPADQAAAESILSQVVGNLQRSAAAAAGLLDAALRDTTALAQPSHAHEALKFAVWTRKELIPPAEVDRLWPIWGRHFRPE
jgi:5'-methylthioadenosine phosphorylase